MARPTLPDEIKMARGTYRPGRANAAVNGLCEGANRQIEKARVLLDAESLAVYAEAIERIEFDTPHITGKHAVPDSEALEDIQLIEQAVDALLDSIGASEHIRDALRLRSAVLYRLIIDQRARAA